MREPRVSVIIPTYNRAADIARCLDSLVRQSCQDFEVLVCDDGSTDSTAQVVEHYRDKLDLVYQWTENFGGPARPRNIGLRLSRAKYVAFLDSDDWWTPRKLEVCLKYLAQGADVVYHDLHLVMRRNQQLLWRKSRSRHLRRPVFDDLLVNGNALNNSSVIIRREFLQAIGGFSEDRALIAAEDYDAWLRVARITDAFVKVPQTLGYYWVGSGNLSNPTRTIAIMETFERRYSSELHSLRARHNIYWPDYVKARAHYALGAYDKAQSGLAALRGSNPPWLIRMKSLWMSIAMGLQRTCSRV